MADDELVQRTKYLEQATAQRDAAQRTRDEARAKRVLEG